MICRNCGKEFEGQFCPHCGHDSSKPTKAEKASKRKESVDKVKEKLKPASDFVKKHKLLVIIVAAVLAVAIIVGTTLGVVLSNDFRVGKMNQIKIGMTKAEVEKKLGKPHEDEASTWTYYSKNYKKLIDEANVLLNKLETLENEKELEKIIARMEELEKESETAVRDEIRIIFSDDKVYAVEMLKDFSEETKNAKKEVKKARLSEKEVKRFTTLQSPVYAIVEYKDGSYRNAPVVLKEQLNTETEGKQSVTWHDEWSDTDVTAEIKVVKNPKIYDGAKAENLMFSVYKNADGTFRMEIAGEGEIDSIPLFSEISKEQLKSNLTSVVIGNGVTRIDSYAFSSCSSLVSVEIPNSVTSIGDSAFSSCSSLESVEIPTSVTSIGSYAFSSCSSLVSVEIPSSVTGIGSDAFNGCSSIETITVAEGNTTYHSAGNCIIETETKTLIVGCKNSIIPTDGSVTSIGSSAFSYCSNLISVVIPNSVTSINGNPFAGCSSLETITVAEGNTKYHSAENCLIETEKKTLITGCKNSIIPTDGSVTSIGSSAFRDCSSLESVVIPTSVTSIGSSAFRDCSSLESVVIPTSVTSIGSSAFEGCSSLVSVEIPRSVTSIGSYAFYNCSSLVSVEIPSGVTSIGSYAFSSCSSLESVVIPTSVTNIGDYAFSSCRSLTKVEISDIAAWCGIKFSDYSANPLYYAKHLYINGEEVTELVIPEGVTSIGSYAFYNCSSLVSVVIPTSVTSIGHSAFSGTGIWNNTAKNNVVYADKWAVGYKGEKSTVTNIALRADTVGIGNSTFSNCSSLVNVVIPDNVTDIGSYAFSGCSSLVSVEIPNSVTSIGSDAFYNCSSLESIEYGGTKAEWEAIAKGSYWNYNTGNYTVTCTDGTLSK